MTRIRAQINEKSPGKIMFLARDRMEALQHERALKQAGQVTANADPNVTEFKGADFFPYRRAVGFEHAATQRGHQ